MSRGIAFYAAGLAVGLVLVALTYVLRGGDPMGLPSVAPAAGALLLLVIAFASRRRTSS